MSLQMRKNIFIILFILFLEQLFVASNSLSAIPKLENGFVEFLEFGKGYRFDCEEGYQLVGQSEIYYENNKWSDHIPICVRIKEQIDFPFGNYVVSENGRKYTFSCNAGYYLKGRKEIFYKNNNWDGSVPKCIENLNENMESDDNVENNDTEYENSDNEEINDGNGENNDNEYVDNDGNENNENDTPFVDENDFNENITFTYDPTCLNSEAVTLINGFVRKIRNKCKYAFSCKKGFTLIGDKEIEFVSNEWSSKMPVCVPTLHLEINNGNFEINVDAEYYIIHYKCADGYKLDGDSEIILKIGQIYNVDKPSCQSLCPVIPFYFGRIAINEKTHTANFTCDDGYQLKGLSQSVCENGKWSHPPPICIPSCPKINLINGNVTINENIATFCCDTNYVLMGNKNSMCSQGQWLDETPICAAKCPEIKITEAHKIISFDVESNYYQFSCHDDYILKGNSEIFCRYGQWSHPIPICETKNRSYEATNGFTITTVASECHISSSGLKLC